jgi:hypothetical protein
MWLVNMYFYRQVIFGGIRAEPRTIEGNRKNDLISITKFDFGESNEPQLREARALRWREFGDIRDRTVSWGDSIGAAWRSKRSWSASSSWSARLSR